MESNVKHESLKRWSQNFLNFSRREFFTKICFKIILTHIYEGILMYTNQPYGKNPCNSNIDKLS